MAVDWYNFERDVFIQYSLDHASAVIGGPGKEVEIDESEYGKLQGSDPMAMCGG